ncbi:hypothetical protein BD289DRAFT_127641 [Coniella lustricola]|uniref:Uncharacterized protein n=1 Tax=Coniella lustricola TaxID=2025994 RepID=A0A2T2ZW72_9PEZI|nr:hypothetical protein BD289DRAFT_127641 [Coniella lustricola]
MMVFRVHNLQIVAWLQGAKKQMNYGQGARSRAVGCWSSCVGSWLAPFDFGCPSCWVASIDTAYIVVCRARDVGNHEHLKTVIVFKSMQIQITLSGGSRATSSESRGLRAVPNILLDEPVLKIHSAKEKKSPVILQLGTKTCVSPGLDTMIDMCEEAPSPPQSAKSFGVVILYTRLLGRAASLLFAQAPCKTHSAESLTMTRLEDDQLNYPDNSRAIAPSLALLLDGFLRQASFSSLGTSS